MKDRQFVEGDSDTLSSQACGDTLYDWPDQYEASPPISDYFTFEGNPNRRITVETIDPARYGTHVLKFSA